MMEQSDLAERGETKGIVESVSRNTKLNSRMKMDRKLDL